MSGGVVSVLIFNYFKPAKHICRLRRQLQFLVSQIRVPDQSNLRLQLNKTAAQDITSHAAPIHFLIPGNSSVNTDPAPSLERTFILPPWLTAIILAIDNPKPCPGTAPRESSTR